MAKAAARISRVRKSGKARAPLQLPFPDLAREILARIGTKDYSACAAVLAQYPDADESRMPKVQRAWSAARKADEARRQAKQQYIDGLAKRYFKATTQGAHPHLICTAKSLDDIVIATALSLHSKLECRNAIVAAIVEAAAGVTLAEIFDGALSERS